MDNHNNSDEAKMTGFLLPFLIFSSFNGIQLTFRLLNTIEKDGETIKRIINQNFIPVFLSRLFFFSSSASSHQTYYYTLGSSWRHGDDVKKKQKCIIMHSKIQFVCPPPSLRDPFTRDSPSRLSF